MKAVFAHADIVSLASLHLPVPLAPDSGTQGLSFPKTSVLRIKHPVLPGVLPGALHFPAKFIFNACTAQQTARYNYQLQAREGLPPDMFPPDVPVYTGHYHLPHTVPNSHITYIGSPYQGGRMCGVGC